MWSLAPALRPTLASLRVTDPEKVALVEARVFQGQLEDTLWQVTMAALAIDLGVAAAVTTGPLGVGLTLAAAGTGLADAIMQTDEYALASATSRSDLDANESLTPPDELQNAELMLAIAWISIGLDVADAMKLASTVGRLGRTVSLMDAVAESGVQTRIPAEALEAAARRSRGAVLLGEEGAGALDEGVDAITDARRAAAVGDSEETRRLFLRAKAELPDAESDALWGELSELLGEVDLATVYMGNARHTLKWDGGTLLLCSDCAALDATFAWLRGRSAGATVDTLQALLDAAEAEAHRVRGLAAAGDVADSETQELTRLLGEIADHADVECLSCVGDVVNAATYGRFADASHLEGKTVAEALQDDVFNAHYTVDKNGDISRRKGHTTEWPKLTAEDGAVRFGTATPRPIDFPAVGPTGARLTPAEREAFLAQSSPAWVSYRTALLDQGVYTRDELIDLVDEAVESRRAVTVDNVRHAVHVATRDRVVDTLFEGLDATPAGASEAHRRMLEFTTGLNPSYQGNIAERWYVRYRRVFPDAQGDTAELLTHVRMKAADNPEMLSAERVPDNLHVIGREAGDVKSTSSGLNGHDTEQLDEVFVVMQEQGAAVLQVGSSTARATSFRLTFTNPKGALGSVDTLEVWLERYDFLRVEVFDSNGVPHLVDKTNVADLSALLTRWAA